MNKYHFVAYLLTIFVLIIMGLYLPSPYLGDIKPPDPPYNLIFIPIFVVLVLFFDFLDKKRGKKNEYI